MAVLLALDAPARIARTIERVDVTLLPRRRGLVVALPEESLQHVGGLPRTPLH
jgi:hypothetical protein